MAKICFVSIARETIFDHITSHVIWDFLFPLPLIYRIQFCISFFVFSPSWRLNAKIGEITKDNCHVWRTWIQFAKREEKARKITLVQSAFALVGKPREASRTIKVVFNQFLSTLCNLQHRELVMHACDVKRPDLSESFEKRCSGWIINLPLINVIWFIKIDRQLFLVRTWKREILFASRVNISQFVFVSKFSLQHFPRH
jgi:hypothetical protein